MKKKYLSFVKNAGIATLGAVAGGVAGAELADLVSDSPTVISAASTAGQYTLSFAVFLPLHAQDNPDLYRDSHNHFRWRTFARDMTKLTLGCGFLEYFYLIARPVATYTFQKRGYDPVTASLLSDAVCIPPYIAAAIPIARGLGIIREEK